jgi:hypothetical protein
LERFEKLLESCFVLSFIHTQPFRLQDDSFSVKWALVRKLLHIP